MSTHGPLMTVNPCSKLEVRFATLWSSSLQELYFRTWGGFNSNRVQCFPCVIMEDVITLGCQHHRVLHTLNLASSCRFRGQLCEHDSLIPASSTFVAGVFWDSAYGMLVVKCFVPSCFLDKFFSRCLLAPFGSEHLIWWQVSREQMMTVRRRPTIQTILQFGLCPPFPKSFWPQFQAGSSVLNLALLQATRRVSAF